MKAYGYAVTTEASIGDGKMIDVVATRNGTRVAFEIETGKSNIKENLAKISKPGFDRVALLATSPAAVAACQRVIDASDGAQSPPLELLTWLDISQWPGRQMCGGNSKKAEAPMDLLRHYCKITKVKKTHLSFARGYGHERLLSINSDTCCLCGFL